MRGKAFPQETVDLAMKLYEEGQPVQDIADATGVTVSTIKRWADRGQSMRRLYAEDDHFIVPSEVLADRERRLSLAPRDITAAFFGDPLPGYSVLDRR